MHTHTDTYTHTHTHMNACTHTRTHAHTHTRTRAHTHTHTHTHTSILVHESFLCSSFHASHIPYCYFHTSSPSVTFIHTPYFHVPCLLRRVLEELLQTEEAYASDLKLVVEVTSAKHAPGYRSTKLIVLCFSLQKCRPRFVSDVMPNTLRGKEEIIFSNIHEIEEFHRR